MSAHPVELDRVVKKKAVGISAAKIAELYDWSRTRRLNNTISEWQVCRDPSTKDYIMECFFYRILINEATRNLLSWVDQCIFIWVVLSYPLVYDLQGGWTSPEDYEI